MVDSQKWYTRFKKVCKLRYRLSFKIRIRCIVYKLAIVALKLDHPVYVGIENPLLTNMWKFSNILRGNFVPNYLIKGQECYFKF